MASHSRQTGASSNPLDIDGQTFDKEAYLTKKLKERTIDQILDDEHRMVQEVRKLDSDMQTLVYENYAKFITATDTIRRMRSDFTDMEKELETLMGRMGNITEFSERLCTRLEERNENLTRLVKLSDAVAGVQHINDLPQTMRDAMRKQDYSAAVKAFVEIRPQMDEHPDLFVEIAKETRQLVEELKQLLREQFRSQVTSTAVLVSTFDLLKQLGEGNNDLARDYLTAAQTQLQNDLQTLAEKAKGDAEDAEAQAMDVLEFVDAAASGFLSNTCLVVTAYLDLFEDRVAAAPRAYAFLKGIMNEFFAVVARRFDAEPVGLEDPSLLVRALDRLYRRVQSTAKLIDVQGCDAEAASLTHDAMRLVTRVAQAHCDRALLGLTQGFTAHLSEIRQHLAAPRQAIVAPGAVEANQPLVEELSKLEQSITHSLKTCVANLLQYTAYEITFASKQQFLTYFGSYVRENVLAEYFRSVISTCNDIVSATGDKAFVTPSVVLLLAKLCANLSNSTVAYLLDLCEKQFRISPVDARRQPNLPDLTPAAQLQAAMHSTAQRLVDHFVHLEGAGLSQMLSKSVATRDWIACVEPRSVRAVMKRVVEDVSAIDARVGQLFEEGSKNSRGSDSSRRSRGHSGIARSTGRQLNIATAGAAAGDSNSLLKKLWSEKIDYFASVELTRVSIVTGIVKICLKTLLECVRLRTFGRYGLQHIQVDCHYLQLYLWRFVSDENMVQHLLEEILSSAALRCIDPAFMDPSVVDVICERG